MLLALAWKPSLSSFPGQERSPTLCNNKISIWVFAAVRFVLFCFSTLGSTFGPRSGPRMTLALDARVGCILSLPADYAQFLGQRERWCGLPCWASSAGIIVINALFTLKVSLLVLLSLDLSLVDCKFNSLCDPKAIPLQMPGSKDGPRLGSRLLCVGGSPCAFT